MFEIGEKVVCIDLFRLDEDHAACGVIYPLKGNMYTIRSIEMDDGRCFLRLEEIVNPKVNYNNGYDECQFVSYGFRKLDYDFAEEVMANIKEQVNTESYV